MSGALSVVFVLNSFGAGGTERSTAVLIPELQRRGVTVRAVTLQRVEEGDEESVRAGGLAVHVLHGRALATRVRELRRLLYIWRPDVVHTALYEADVIGRLACVGTSFPVMSSLVNTSYEPARFADPRVRRWRLRMVQAVDGWTARHLADHFHAVSPGVVDAGAQALGIDPAKVTVIERGRDWSSFGAITPARRANARAALGIPEDAYVILAVGRQEFQKAHTDLVAALAQLASSVPRARVIIAGREGNGSGDLRAAIDLHALHERVTLLGYRRDVPELLAAADVFALPSVYEGTAGAALEALAMGVPVVSTRVRGLAGVLEHERNALMVEASRPEQLAGALERIAVDVDLARSLAAQGRRDIEERFGLDRSAERMLELYQSLATARGR